MFVKLLASLLLACSAYLGWWSFAYASPMWLLGSGVALTCSVGLFRGAGWARYLWYAIAISCAAAWGWIVARTALTGWPYPDGIHSFIALLPGLVLLAILAGGSAAVSKHYRRS